MRTLPLHALVVLVALALSLPGCGDAPAEEGSATGGKRAGPLEGPSGETASTEPAAVKPAPVLEDPALKASIDKALVWLREAQHESGGFGAGLHSAQNIRDPHAVKLDPATTAFVTLTLLRADGGRLDGSHKVAIGKAVAWLVDAIEQGPKEGPQITALKGTQPQSKLGASVDTAMAAQCLARVVPLLAKEHALKSRADKALSVCIEKLERSQEKNGTWAGGGGWAPVLQASLACQALELSQRAGKRIDRDVLRRARNFQQSNSSPARGIDSVTIGRGRGGAIGIAGGGNAGVELYSFATSNRAMAPRVARLEGIRKLAEAQGKITAGGAPLSAETVSEVGDLTVEEAKEVIEAADKLNEQSKRLNDDRLLKGFGSNGGEEFLSYLLTSEALLIAGGKAWEEWNSSMAKRMRKIQSANGSWTGHHCITSPVFCTAAVLQTLTVARDRSYLSSITASEIEKDAQKAAK